MFYWHQSLGVKILINLINCNIMEIYGNGKNLKIILKINGTTTMT